jgi:hypothetical protein
MQTPSAPSPLSSLICDPFVRAAFQRAEQKRDDGHALSITNDRPRTLNGGAAERLFEAREDQLVMAYA